MNRYRGNCYQEYPNIFQKNNEWEILATIYEKDPRPSTLIDKGRFLNDKTFEALIVARYYQLIALEKFYEDLIVSSNKIVSIIDKNK